MITFQPANPFPLLPDLEARSISEMRAHSGSVDKWLGLRTLEIERTLAIAEHRLRSPRDSSGETQELWLGLDVQALLTPYVELRWLFERFHLRPGQTVVDLGAAYGRMGFVLARHHRGVRFIGYEYVGERVEETRRCFNAFAVDAYSRRELVMEHADLASETFRPADADLYFIHDYGNLKAIEKTLYDLRRIARTRTLSLVGRGRHCRYLIDARHPWLVAEPQNSERAFTIYRSSDSLLISGVAAGAA